MMNCRQCQEAVREAGCTRRGVCGKTPEVAAAQDLLVQSLMVLSKGTFDKELPAEVVADIEERAVDGLFMTLTNTNFDREAILAEFESNKALKAEHGIACTPTIVGGCDCMTLAGQIGIDSFDADPDLRSLKELLLTGLKGLAAYYHHAVILGYTDPAVPAFLRKGLAAIRSGHTAEELVALNMECGAVGVVCMALLDKANTETYGTPEITSVPTRVGDRPGILITGHDLKDLHMLLQQTEGTGIDVYTHGEMLPANAYPELKAYSHLRGNYGGAWHLQKQEFDSFNGPVLVTTNCIQIPDEGYRGRIFTTGVAGAEGLTHIRADADGSKDFSALIEMAKGCAPPTPIDDHDLVIGLAHATVLSLADKIVEAVKNGDITRFVVMAGCDGREKSREYYTEFAKALPETAVILTAGCAKYRYNKLDLGDIGGIPRVVDAGQCNDCYSLVVIASKLAEVFETDINGLPLSFNISWYEQKACLVLLSLLHLGVKDIMLGPRLPVFLTPGITQVLVDTFGIQPNSDVESDMRILRIE